MSAIRKGALGKALHGALRAPLGLLHLTTFARSTPLLNPRDLSLAVHLLTGSSEIL
jgi:hypothetical protein